MTVRAPASPKRIAVIGAGPGGLAAAMILAHRGFGVEVFEAKDRVGGRNASLELGPYRFDVGPTFLMMKYILDEVFEEGGAASADYLRFVRLEPMYRLEFDDFALRCFSDPAKIKREIAQAFPGSEQRFDRFHAGESKRFAHMAPCLQQPYSTFGSLFSKNLLKALPHLSLGRTVFQTLYRYFGHEKLALAFSFQSKYLGMSAWECPAAFSMLGYIEYAFGVYHTMGGLSEISRAMSRVAEKEGARIHLSTPVKSLIVEGRTAKGVLLENGEKRFYDDVIINADFAWAMENLVPGGVLKKYAPEQLKRKRFSCSTFMMYLGLDTMCDLPHHTIFMARDYRRNVEDIFNRGILSDEISFYVRNASVTDDTLAPTGHSALYVLVPVPNLRGAVDWEETAPAFRERVLKAVAARARLRDLERHVRAEKIITPADWLQDYSVYAGATFNLAHTIPQMLYFRPRNKFEEIDNCYLVGGGTHPGSGVPTILESGRIAANMLSKRYGLPFTSHNKQV